MIGTRILKIDSEIAEIIEVKVGTCHLKIDILLLHRIKKIILVLHVPTLTSNISAISKSILKIFVPSAFPVANFLNFFKLTQLLYFGRVEADKIAKAMWKQYCGTPCNNVKSIDLSDLKSINVQ